MSGGGGGGPTSSTVTQTNVPEWLRPQVETLIGGATKELFDTTPVEGGGQEITRIKPFTPYSQNAEEYVAGFSPLQQQAFGAAGNLQLPGQFGAATAGTQGAALGAAGIGDRYMGMATNPFSMQSFMSPYMQNVVDVQQQQAQRQADIANQAMNAKFAQQGAFGGVRQGLAGAQANAELMRQKQNIQATGLQNAFQQAQQAQQFGANLGLQGLNAALAGYGQLGNLGTQQLAAQRDIIGTQNQMGALQREREQNVINQRIQNFAQAQENPMLRLNQFNALLRGYAQPGTTTTQYQAAPPMANQLASLGMGAYGASKMLAKGGAVKEPQRMATGGLPAINRKVLFDPDSVSLEQVQQGVKNETLSDLIGVPVALQKQKAQQSAISVPDQSPNMMDQAMQPAGIAGLPSNTSVPMAKGGIVAFNGEDEEGSLVSSDGASIADLLAERLGESPGQPKVYSALASMYPSLIKNIFEFTPKDMTPKEAAEYRAQYIKEAKEAGGPSPYEAYRKQLDELTGKRDTELEKGAAWLQAAGALVQPGTTSFMQGLGQAGSTLGQKYAQIAKADTDAKRARAQMEFNLLDAERKERMGLHRDATASVAQARKDRIALNTSELNKRRAVADLVGKGMTATKPTSAGAGRPPSKMNIQQAAVDATEAFLKNPTPENKARMEAMSRLLDQSRVSEIGPNRFASTLTGPQVRTDVEVNETTKQILMGIVEHPLSKDYNKAVKAGDADAASGIEARIRESVRAGFTPMPKPTGTPKPTAAPKPTSGTAPDISSIKGAPEGATVGKFVQGKGWEVKDSAGKLLGYAGD